MTLPNNIQTPVRRPQFGSGGTSATGLGGLTGIVANAFQALEKDRGRQMIVEDFIGFGLLRTGVDLYRGKAYGNDSWNVPAAMERLFRETTSILTDNLLGGVVAAALGRFWFDRQKQAFSNAFTDYPTLELFQQITQENLGGKLSSKQAEKAFLDALLKRFQTVDSKEQCRQALKAAWRQGAQEATTTAPAAASFSHKISSWLPNWLKQASGKPASTTAPKSYAELAAELARGISPSQNTFDRALKVKDASHVFKLDSLLEDVSRFSKQMHILVEKEAKQGGRSQWQALASNTLKKTLTAKNWKLPIGMLAGMGATFAMPFLSAALTRKVYGIKYYPGEIGLKQNQNEDKSQNPNATSTTKQSFIEKHFPYLLESHKNGNYLPLALTLIPIPFAFLFNTSTMRFINPFRQGAQKTLRNMFDFCKAKPFTAPQQMASMFALLITSRLLCARSDNEFRERLVDSFAGWGLWILGTPIIKKLAATLSDQYQGTQLLKDAADGSKTQLLRTQPEIELLLKNSLVNGKRVAPDVVKKTLTANVWMGAISTIASVALLGLVEPWLAMKWTQQNERNKQAKRAASNAAPPIVSASPLQRKPFYLQNQSQQANTAFPVVNALNTNPSVPSTQTFQPQIQTNTPVSLQAQTTATPSVYAPTFYAPPSPFVSNPSPFVYQGLAPGQAGQAGIPG